MGICNTLFKVMSKPLEHIALPKTTSALAFMDKGITVENDRKNRDNRTARQEGIHLFLRLFLKCFNNPLLLYLLDRDLLRSIWHTLFII